MDKFEKIVIYFEQPAKVNCDGNCQKAWGINNRPKVMLSDDEDDYYYIPDGELGIAPADPGTYEGRDGKPSSNTQFPNKWCVRECERCNMSHPGEYLLPLPIRSFDKRVYNIPSKHPEATDAQT